MTADAGTLTTVQKAIIDTLSVGRLAVYGGALSLMKYLGAMSLAFLGIDLLFGETDVFKKLFKKIMDIGWVLFFLIGFGPGIRGMNLSNIALQGAQWVGNKASGGKVVTDVLNNPSQIITLGAVAVKPLFDKLWLHPVMALPLFLLGAVIRFAYYVLALQVFLCQTEFALVCAIGIIFLPFMVLPKTTFMAEKYFSAVISFGIKLMVLICIIGIAFPILQQFTLPADAKLDDCFNLLFAVCFIAFFAWQAPGVASAVLAGSPSLSAGTAAAGAVAAGMTAVATAGGTAGGTAAASKVAGGLLGAVTKGGTSAMKHPIQAMRAGNRATGPYQAFKSGQQVGASLSEGNKSPLEGKNINATGDKTNSSPGMNRESPLKSKYVPPEEKAGPGAGVTLSKEED